uniref:Uncharacterized protein n=1 Tax=Nelumbo nucifera TaxID=4432 RepID=A0A822Y2C0_NELNU|nr:TPA_asm: hypothetical protein HUJ06_029512 [Nelumbo nucifera]
MRLPRQQYNLFEIQPVGGGWRVERKVDRDNVKGFSPISRGSGRVESPLPAKDINLTNMLSASGFGGNSRIHIQHYRYYRNNIHKQWTRQTKPVDVVVTALCADDDDDESGNLNP